MRKPYPTDLSDAEWARLRSYLPTPKAEGRPRTHSLREVLDAIFFYVLKSGCHWRLLPHDFPPWNGSYAKRMRSKVIPTAVDSQPQGPGPKNSATIPARATPRSAASSAGCGLCSPARCGFLICILRCIQKSYRMPGTLVNETWTRHKHFLWGRLAGTLNEIHAPSELPLHPILALTFSSVAGVHPQMFEVRKLRIRPPQ
jgi:hypothetical protein